MRWRRLLIDYNANVQLMNDSVIAYRLNIDTLAHKFTVSRKAYVLQYTQIGHDTLLLQGEWKQEPVSIKLVRNKAAFPLLNRKFRWINETPYNH